MNEFSFSASESVAFGLDVFRAKITGGDFDFFRDRLIENHVDVVISRIDVNLQESLLRLYLLVPNSYLADTLVYYSSEFLETYKNEIPEIIQIHLAKIDMFSVLESLINKIFTGYKNHYHSNPLFGSVDLAKGYLEWSIPYLADVDKICLILFDNDIPCGFLTAKIFEKEGYADIILNGVLKEYEGQGKYSLLLKELKTILGGLGIKRIIVSTQLTNSRVQRVWAKENFHLDKSFYTFHHIVSEKAKNKLNALTYGIYNTI